MEKDQGLRVASGPRGVNSYSRGFLGQYNFSEGYCNCGYMSQTCRMYTKNKFYYKLWVGSNNDKPRKVHEL